MLVPSVAMLPIKSNAGSGEIPDARKPRMALVANNHLRLSTSVGSRRVSCLAIKSCLQYYYERGNYFK